MAETVVPAEVAGRLPQQMLAQPPPVVYRVGEINTQPKYRGISHFETGFYLKDYFEKHVLILAIFKRGNLIDLTFETVDLCKFCHEPV